MYFLNQANIAGANDVAATFRSITEGKTARNHGHMKYLIAGGACEPGSGMPANLKAPSENLGAFFDLINPGWMLVHYRFKQFGFNQFTEPILNIGKW